MEAGIVPGRTKLVLVESPTNPRMQVCDIRAIADIAHAAGAVVCVDNSIMAPVFQRPLDLGADISMTSATKFIGGHSDITGGILTVKGPELADRIYFIQASAAAAVVELISKHKVYLHRFCSTVLHAFPVLCVQTWPDDLLLCASAECGGCDPGAL